ncbi:STAS domain-containing protein [Amorphoplanes digitatis]|uniref:Anti-anti-sigma factor n=1 Tax=Actinoplanes digitatis TaxID=1868 RepID=A0A7W7MND1_9ACTN|nr:STAS domain-containing protein [Actinoplanes digitatis]MBB4760415.1 anti-anti-sigma factor [Actinoplanes digitatis]BFE68551.1 STAS domain-containing protein [Actinoplanes digitatis]GID95373.1 anti-sigma factor antagonist [Actinoplanes digitatis]
MDQDGAETIFSVSTSTDGDRATVVVSGEVDMSTADAMFEAATGAGFGGVVLDLRDVTFFDSAAIHALVRLAERYPGALEVIPSRQVHRVLDISGLASQPWLLQRG